MNRKTWLVVLVVAANAHAETINIPFVDCSGNSSNVSAQNIQISAVGDLVFTPNEKFNSKALEQASIFFKQTDMAFANLEGPITDRGVLQKVSRAGHTYAFRFPVSTAKFLREADIDAVNIANNHIRDYGAQGVQDTIRYGHQQKIMAIGNKGSIFVKEIKGRRVGLMTFGYHNAQNDMKDFETVVASLQAAKAQTDLLVVAFHAGAEGAPAAHLTDGVETYLGENRGNPRAFAKLAIENGADAVIGFGPHVLRGAECVNGKPVLHSLGNFVSAGGLSIAGASSLTVIGQVAFGLDGTFLGARVIPMTFNVDKTPVFDPTARSVQMMNILSQTAKNKLKQFNPLYFSPP